MTKILLLLLFLGSVTVIAYTHYLLRPASKNAGHFISDKGKEESSRLRKRAAILKAFALKRGYSTIYCLLADLELPSGKNRFFVYNLIKDSIVLSALVAHGSCNTPYLEKVWFSNEPGCGCFSLPHFIIHYSLFLVRYSQSFISSSSVRPSSVSLYSTRKLFRPSPISMRRYYPCTSSNMDRNRKMACTRFSANSNTFSKFRERSLCASDIMLVRLFSMV